MSSLERRRVRRWLGWKSAALLGLGGAGLAVAASLWSRRRPWGAPVAEPLAPRRRAWVPGPAGSLYLEEAGSGGLPWLLVHGLAGSSRHWRPVLDLLGSRRHMVALDLRGHGSSDPAAQGEYHVEDYAGDVLAVADALGLRSFGLAGHSLGGLVAVECAGRQPERVAALALVDPSGDSSRLPGAEIDAVLTAVAKEPRGELELHYRQFLVGAGPATSEAVLEDLAQTPEELLAPSLEASLAYPAAESLGRFHGPAACLVTPFNDSSQSLPRLAPDLPARRVRGTSHWIMLDRPEEVALALEELSRRVSTEVVA